MLGPTSLCYMSRIEPGGYSGRSLQGFVLSGSTMEYFRFDLPEGLHSLFVMVKILYSDEPDVMLDFYATRNLLWTKRTPYETEQVAAHHRPAVQKDVDASIHLPFEVTNILVRRLAKGSDICQSLAAVLHQPAVYKLSSIAGVPPVGNILRCYLSRGSEQ